MLANYYVIKFPRRTIALRSLEPFDTALAFERVVLSIDVARLTARPGHAIC